MLSVINPKKVVTTRKEHLCNTCHRRQPKGSKMQRSVLKYDDIYTWRTCETCTKLLDEFPDMFIDEVEGVFWDGCVNDPSNWCNELIDQYNEDPTPEYLLKMLRLERWKENIVIPTSLDMQHNV